MAAVLLLLKYTVIYCWSEMVDFEVRSQAFFSVSVFQLALFVFNETNEQGLSLCVNGLKGEGRHRCHMVYTHTVL